jgi:hypothetical protein
MVIIQGKMTGRYMKSGAGHLHLISIETRFTIQQKVGAMGGSEEV